MRLAIIGGGIIGRTHAEAIRACPTSDLAAIVDPFETGKALAQEYGCAHFQSLDDLIAWTSGPEAGARVEGVIIATPNALHVPQATRMIEAGLPVLVEKPLGESHAKCTALVALSEETAVPGLVGHHRRHNPLLQAAKAAVDSGAFGQLVSGTISATLYKDSPYFDVPWRREAGSGGPLLINLIHEIDLARYLFGEITEVSALSANVQRGFAVEDTAAVILRFQEGGLITIALTDAGVGPWSWDTTAGENLARFPAMPAVSHMFSGTRAGMSLPDLAFWTHEGAQNWTTPQVNRPRSVQPADSYIEQIRHFCAVISGEETPRITLADGARNIAVIEAIQRSVQDRCPVILDPGQSRAV
ncbi:4-carboxy-2-hydroxymuconate-6-semialdehyde dehydrogenase [Aquimixticola soesokkakensis]|uniref:4-carboxy-2-hydroxymuconate-6-semialdehyde dehydrogenase n=1 Tax=Aquimixticola soesokkakensis TaxID=1519096 RepID=A0A1Y5T6C2_9RHOB|nr:Gfo/Idh/MocA family oxidoreductase [Aquimixticola soesokkakensis]SLN54936.1 4-carboxy-2-hydroxymuconate-6-semialdehyde dehydrogenase [Aquimixticola soesokkakensis]